MENTPSVELLRVLRDLKGEIKDEVLGALVPTVKQVTDAVHNSNSITQETIKSENKIHFEKISNVIISVENKYVLKFHLWIIYSLIAILFVSIAYLFASGRVLAKVENNLSNDIILIKEILQNR